MKRLLLVCTVIAACKQTKNHSQPAKTIADSVATQIIDRCTQYYFTENTDSLGWYLNSIHPAVDQLDDGHLTITWVLYKMQEVNLEEKQDSVQYYVRKALSLANSNRISKEDLLNFYVVYGNLLRGQNLIDSAIKIANAAYYLSVDIDSFRYAEVCYDLARLYEYVDDTAKIRHYGYEAWHHNDREPERSPYIAGILASYYYKAKQIDSGLYFLRRFQEDSSMQMPNELKAWQLEMAAVLLSEKGNYHEAETYQLSAMNIQRQIGITDIEQYLTLAEIYGKWNRYQDADLFIDSAIAFAQQKKDFYMAKTAWKIKADLYSKRLLFAQAYKAIDSAYEYYNLEMGSSLRERARELETQYAVREKDNQIKLLAVQNTANLKIRNQQRLIIGIMSFVGALLVVIGYLLWKRRKAQMQRRETVLKQQLFRTQMEPHFLYNLLSVIQSYMKDNKREATANLISKFSRLVRIIFINSQNDLVSLQDELEALHNYLTLQKLLQDNKFEYKINNFCPTDHIMIPPMILQPFVENAILKGFEKMTHGGIITIDLKTVERTLRCTIKDNGQGLMEVPGKKRGSTMITQKRLAILSRQTGHKATLSVEDRRNLNDGHGVRVDISIPFVPLETARGCNNYSDVLKSTN